MLKFEAQVADLVNSPPPPKLLKFSAEVTGGVTVELPKNIKFKADVIQNNDKGSS
jgi:hypothetical protein